MDEERVEASGVRQRWEYRYEQVKDVGHLEDMFNDAGEDCWELVNVLQIESLLSAVFKRPRGLFSSKRERRHSVPDKVNLKAK